MNDQGADDARARRRAQERYDPGVLTASLTRIHAWLEAHNPVVAATLQPGLSRAAIDQATAALPFQLPEEVYHLYQWKNGADRDAPFIWYHSFLSLEDAVAAYRMQMAFNAQFPGTWHPSWFPLFEFQDECYFVACETQPADALPVRYFFLEETERPVSFTNLTTMMATAAAWYESGAVRVADRETGALDDDVRQVKAIHQQHNPDVPFPYYAPDA